MLAGLSCVAVQAIGLVVIVRRVRDFKAIAWLDGKIIQVRRGVKFFGRQEVEREWFRDSHAHTIRRFPRLRKPP